MNFSFYFFFFFIQFDAEFRRWSIKRSEVKCFQEFYKMINGLHRINDTELLISYIDPRDNDLLPINNDDNLLRAASTAQPLLRLIVQRKGMYRWFGWTNLESF